MATVSVRNITSTGCTVRVSGVSKGDDLWFFVRLYNDNSDISGSVYDTASSSTASADIDGLEPDTRYMANVRVNNKWQTGVSFYTDKDEYFSASLRYTCTTNSITAWLANMDTNCSGNRFRCTYYVNGNEVTSFTFTSIPSSGRTQQMTKTGLKAGTGYEILIEIEDLTTGWSDTWSGYVVTDKITVSKWSWSSSNGTASSSETKQAYTALTNKQSVSKFSYNVWNDMCSKVIEIQNAAGLSWSTSYASYANTKMTSSDRVLTAKRFNSLRYNIGRSVSTGISDVSKGDTVYASYFTKLTQCMNNWIDKL